MTLHGEVIASMMYKSTGSDGLYRLTCDFRNLTLHDKELLMELIQKMISNLQFNGKVIFKDILGETWPSIGKT